MRDWNWHGLKGLSQLSQSKHPTALLCANAPFTLIAFSVGAGRRGASRCAADFAG